MRLAVRMGWLSLSSLGLLQPCAAQFTVQFYQHRPPMTDRISHRGNIATSPQSLAAVETSPRIAASPDGTMLAVWQSESAGVTSIRKAVSEDHGKSWLQDVVLTPTSPQAVSCTDPDIAFAANSKCAAVWSSLDAGTTNPDVFMSTSLDGGNTWQTKVRLAPFSETAGTTETKPRIASMGGTKWVAAWIRQSEDLFFHLRNVLVSVSVDDGITWSPADVITSGGAYGALDVDVAVAGERVIVSLQNLSWGPRHTGTATYTFVGNPLLHDWLEPVWGPWSKVKLLNGRIAGFGYNSGSGYGGYTNNKLYSCVSDDFGSTWTTENQFDYDGTDYEGPWRMDSAPSVATDGGPRLIAVWEASIRRFTEAIYSSSNDLYLAFSNTAGDSWWSLSMLNPDPFQFMTNNTGARVACTDNGNFAVVWQSSSVHNPNASKIKFAAGELPSVAAARDSGLYY